MHSLDNAKNKHFYCLANTACSSLNKKYKMSLGCTSGPTDHLLTRHGIRAQKSILVENTRAELLGKRIQTSPWLVSLNHIVSGLYYTGSDVMFTGSGLFTTGSGIMFYRIRPFSNRIRYNVLPDPAFFQPDPV